MIVRDWLVVGTSDEDSRRAQQKDGGEAAAV